MRSQQQPHRDPRGNRCSALRDLRPGLPACRRTVLEPARAGDRSGAPWESWCPKGPRHVSQVSFLGCRPWSPTWPLSGLLEPPRERGEAAQLRTLRLRSSPWWPREGRLGLPGAWFSVPAWPQSPPEYGCESGSSCEPQVYTPPGLGPPRVRREPSSKRWLPGGLRADFQALRASAEWIPFRSPSRPRWGPRENVELRRRDCNSLTVTRLAFEGRGEWAGVLGVFKLVE